MLSNGQIIFTILFAIAFILTLVYAYKKDLKLHQKYYKGSIWILIFFIAFLLFIIAIKFFLG